MFQISDAPPLILQTPLIVDSVASAPLNGIHIIFGNNNIPAAVITSVVWRCSVFAGAESQSPHRSLDSWLPATRRRDVFVAHICLFINLFYSCFSFQASALILFCWFAFIFMAQLAEAFIWDTHRQTHTYTHTYLLVKAYRLMWQTIKSASK